MNIWVFLYRLAWTALIVLLIVGIASVFLPKVKQYREMRQREEAMQEDIRLQEDMVRSLRDRQERLQQDPAFVEKIAREEFGLARPGEVVFKFSEDEPRTAPK